MWMVNFRCFDVDFLRYQWWRYLHVDGEVGEEGEGGGSKEEESQLATSI